jgi:hypothetical protein
MAMRPGAFATTWPKQAKRSAGSPCPASGPRAPHRVTPCTHQWTGSWFRASTGFANERQAGRAAPRYGSASSRNGRSTPRSAEATKGRIAMRIYRRLRWSGQAGMAMPTGRVRGAAGGVGGACCGRRGQIAGATVTRSSRTASRGAPQAGHLTAEALSATRNNPWPIGQRTRSCSIAISLIRRSGPKDSAELRGERTEIRAPEARSGSILQLDPILPSRRVHMRQHPVKYANLGIDGETSASLWRLAPLPRLG